jgi:hypothetical protein
MSTYNGWTNWATWNVALWVDNREEYYYARLATATMNAGKEWTAETVEDFVRAIFPEGTPDMADGVMMVDGLDAVNYEELTEHWNEE